MNPHGYYPSKWDVEQRMIQKEKHILYEKRLITSAILSLIAFAGFTVYFIVGKDHSPAGAWFASGWLITTIVIRLLLKIWIKEYSDDVKNVGNYNEN